MQKYNLEFILHTQNSSLEVVKNSLSEFGDSLEVSEFLLENTARGRDFKINMNTEDPTAIFDICGQIGRIRQIKVKEEGGK
jgi:dihydroxyacetone kinase-like predicted kinase